MDIDFVFPLVELITSKLDLSHSSCKSVEGASIKNIESVGSRIQISKREAHSSIRVTLRRIGESVNDNWPPSKVTDTR